MNQGVNQRVYSRIARGRIGELPRKVFGEAAANRNLFCGPVIGLLQWLDDVFLQPGPERPANNSPLVMAAAVAVSAGDLIDKLLGLRAGVGKTGCVIQVSVEVPAEAGRRETVLACR